MPIKFKRISADEAREKRKDHMRSTDRGEAVMKASRGSGSWDSETRSARFIMTTEQVDRYGDVVVTEGLDTAEFERNPVALLFHSSRSWPIGKWGNLEKLLKGRPRRLEGDLILLPPGGPVPEIDQAAWMIENDGIRACSVGFIPDWDEVEMILDDEERWTGGLRFVKSELVECSACPVPANPGALMKHAAGNMRLAKELLEHVLDTYAKTPAGLLVPRAEFEKQYRLVVEQLKPSQSAQLPVTDEEKAAAEIRSLEFEVAQRCPAIDGAEAVVCGDGVDAKFKVVSGKWKHVGVSADGDEVNFVIVATSADDKRTYSMPAISEDEARKALPKVKRLSATEWSRDPVTETEKAPREVQAGAEFEALRASLKKGDKISLNGSAVARKPTVSIERADGTVEDVILPEYVDAVALNKRISELESGAAETKETAVTLTVDVSESISALERVSALADVVSQKLTSIFAKKDQAQERVEPKIDMPAAPPSAEVIAAARAGAKAAKQRLTEKGLI